jgi:tape measure domain-containing protein
MNRRMDTAKSKLDKTTRSTKRLKEEQEKLAVTSKGLGKIWKTIAGAAVLGLATTAFSKFLKSTIGLAARMESIEIGFETMLGSAAKAKELIKDVKDFALATPFTPQQLFRATDLLLNFGIAQEKILPTLRMIGDVSGGDAEKLQRLTLAFAQVSSQGKLMGQDLLQMINAGFNPLTEISAITGESISELRDRMSQGLIGIDEVAMAFERATAEGGRFFRRMEKGSQSAEGLVSTLAGFRDEVLEMIGKEGLPVFKEILRLLIDMTKQTIAWLKVTENMEGIKNAFKEIGAAVKDTLELLIKLFEIRAKSRGALTPGGARTRFFNLPKIAPATEAFARLRSRRTSDTGGPELTPATPAVTPARAQGSSVTIVNDIGGVTVNDEEAAGRRVAQRVQDGLNALAPRLAAQAGAQ